MKTERLYELLAKEGNGTLLADEKAELARYRVSDSDEFSFVKRMMTSTQDLVYPDANEANEGWQAVMAAIEADDAPSVEEPQVEAPVRRIARYRFLRIAAVGLLLVGAYLLFNRGSDLVLTASGTDLSRELADGSVVTLHGNSTITVEDGFGTEHRHIAMQNGQVHFAAAKNSIPMQVKSPAFEINVLGTEFNVFDNPTQAIATVTLYEGSIQLRLPNGKQIKMAPGDHIVWNRDKKQSSTSRTTLTKPGWKQGLFVFKDTPFEEVFAQLSEEFNVTFKNVELLAGKHFNDNREIKNLEDILARIEKSFGVKIRKSGDATYVIKG